MYEKFTRSGEPFESRKKMARKERQREKKAKEKSGGGKNSRRIKRPLPFTLDCFFVLRINFGNYQNRWKPRKFWGIDLHAILKASAKFKRNWFTSFKIIPLPIFGSLTCILMENTIWNKKLCFKYIKGTHQIW